MVVFFKFLGSQQTLVDAADESDVYEDLNRVLEKDLPNLGSSPAQQQLSLVTLKSLLISGSLVIFLVPSIP